MTDVRPDEPVPAGEPRETVRLRIDLHRQQACEERFDLEVYRHRGIELVAWRPGRSCEGREATIRYLPRRIDRAGVVALARRAARRVLLAR